MAAPHANNDELQAFDLNEYDIHGDVPLNTGLENDEPDPLADLAVEPTQMEEDLGVRDLGVDNVINQASIRKPRPKLDADKLLNPHRGYPALLKSLMKLKYRGSGDEKKYLRKYVMTYQIWANRLWPKANFDDFVLLARRAGRDPRIRQYCRDLIESEKYGSRSEDNLYAQGPTSNVDIATDIYAPETSAPEAPAPETPAPADRDSVDFTTANSTSNSADTNTAELADSDNVDIDPAELNQDDFNVGEPNSDELEALYGDMGF